MQKIINPYLIIAQQQWALNIGSNAHNLAIEFSLHHPVMYINPAIDIKSLGKQLHTKLGIKRLKIALGIELNTIKVAENLWIHTPATINYSINWIKIAWLFDLFSKYNAKAFFSSIKKAISFLEWREEECIALNDSQMFTGQYLKKYFSPLCSFYYLRDNLIKHPYFKTHGSRIEPLTIIDADAVFANSNYLAAYAKQYNDKSFDIGQGCELALYNANLKYLEPLDIKNVPHPRIGYVGFITSERLDIVLLEQLAAAEKNWNWIFIGPEDYLFKKSKLHQLPNVYFLGTKKQEQLPGYLQQLDVCINPQLVNDLTIGNYPRKIDEYLAMGKPVVATATPAMEMFAPFVKLASGANEYRVAIDLALKTNTAASILSINFAKSHTWQSCVEIINLTCMELLSSKEMTTN